MPPGHSVGGPVEAQALQPPRVARVEAGKLDAIITDMKQAILVGKIHVQFAIAFGWNSTADIDYILSHESGFDPWTANQASKACGLFQFLPCDKIGGKVYYNQAMGRWRLDPDSAPVDTQIAAGVKYVKARYGTPKNARKFWEANHYY